MSNPIAKLRPWNVVVGGVNKVISVLSTGVPDIGTLWGTYDGLYNPKNAYKQGAIVRVLFAQNVGGVLTTPGVYGAAVNVDGNAVGNAVPQWPLPATGTVCWYLIAFPPRKVSICAGGNNGNGSNSSIYINANQNF